MKVDPAVMTEINVLETRLADRTLPEAEHIRIKARLADIRRKLAGVPNPEELSALLQRLAILEDAVADLSHKVALLGEETPRHGGIVAVDHTRPVIFEGTTRGEPKKRGRPKKEEPTQLTFDKFLDQSTD